MRKIIGIAVLVLAALSSHFVTKSLFHVSASNDVCKDECPIYPFCSGDLVCGGTSYAGSLTWFPSDGSGPYYLPVNVCCDSDGFTPLFACVSDGSNPFFGPGDTVSIGYGSGTEVYGHFKVDGLTMCIKSYTFTNKPIQ